MQGIQPTEAPEEIVYHGVAAPDALERLQRALPPGDGWEIQSADSGERVCFHVKRNGVLVTSFFQYADGKFRGAQPTQSAVATVALLAAAKALDVTVAFGDTIVDSKQLPQTLPWFAGTPDIDEATDVAESVGLIPPRIRFTPDALASAAVL